jgi:molybdopterin-guanine dinucleotide biosynthesis protein A
VALLEGRRLIDHVAYALSPIVETIITCGGAGGMADRPTGSLGPLAGLNAALHHGRESGFYAVLTVPCDTPMLKVTVLDRLLACRGPAYLEALPVIGFWPCTLAPILDHHIARADRSMRGWIREIGAIGISSEGPIANINTPEDLVALQAQRDDRS